MTSTTWPCWHDGSAITTDQMRVQLDRLERLTQAAIDDDGGQDGGFEDAYGWFTRPPKPIGEDAARMITYVAVPRRILADVRGKRLILESIESLDASADADAGAHAAELMNAMAISLGLRA